jgi:deoxyribose-phosphate aldolase
MIKKATGKGILKVIVETGYLTEEEIKKVTKIVDRAGADFIKTSTGYGPRGASMRDCEIFREESKRLRIKAAGGVRDRESALKFIEIGVTRIGTSSGTKLISSDAPKETPTGDPNRLSLKLNAPGSTLDICNH